jgi:hypothetical protein
VFTPRPDVCPQRIILLPDFFAEHPMSATHDGIKIYHDEP